MLLTFLPGKSTFIIVMNELYDVIRQDFRELYDEIPTDTTSLWGSILNPKFKGRAVYLPLALSGGMPHSFVSLRVALLHGATNFKRCPVVGTYSAWWPDALFR